MATVTGSKRHLDITSNTLTTSANVDVGAKLFITTTDTNTTSTSALVLNNTEVEARTLGSNAFNSTAFLTSETFSSSDVALVLSGNDIIAGTSITLAGGLSYNNSTSTLSQTDNNTTYSAGTLLDLSSTTFNVDLSELANNTSTFAPTQDHFVILDNGVQGKKLGSSIFGSAAYEASSTFATASHNHAGVYAPQYEALQPAGSDREMNVWRKTHAVYSDDGGAATYFIIQTEVPQDNYSMGGFTLVYQEDYSGSGEGGEIKIYGYWNPESNSGFNGFRYECSNPYHTPTIEVCRNSSSGNTAFFISGEGGNYTQLIAKDLWLGYSASSATAQWGNGWVISQADNKNGYTNFDTLNRNDFAAITTNGATPSLTGGVTAAEVRTLIGAGTSSLTLGTSSTTALAGNTSLFDGAYGSLSGVPSTFAPSAHNHDSRYNSTDGSGNDYRWSVNLSGGIGTRWYKVGTVNVGSGGMTLRGLISNHVESFATQQFDIAIQGREGNNNNAIEITGNVNVLYGGVGVFVVSGAEGGTYLNWDVYIVTTNYSMAHIDLTKTSSTFHTSNSYVTSKPTGTVELDTTTLAEGNYVIDDSVAKEIYHEGHKPTYSELGTMGYSNLTGTPTLGTAAAAATTDFATAAQGTTANAALPRSGGTMTGTLAGDGTNLITGFVAPQNPEGSHIKAPWFFNDLAYARLKGAAVSVTVNGGSAASNSTIDAMFDASTGYGSFSTSNVTSVVIEISNMPKNFTYGTHLGVTFGNTTWRAKDIQLESYYGSQWNTVFDVTNQPNEYAVKSYNSSSNSQTKLRWTFSNFNTTSMRIVSLFAYNYNATGMPSLFMPLNGGTMYGSLTMNTGNINLSGNKIYADTSSPTAHIQVGAGTSSTGNRSDVALLGATNGGGVVNALGLLNTATGANSNGVALNFHNGSNYSPTGQILLQQNSSGTATHSAMKFFTYGSSNLTHQMSIKSDGVVRFLSYGTGILSTDTNGNISAISDGTSGQVLTTNGSGGFSFTTVTSGSSYTLPTASDSVLGGIKVGDNLTITEGVLSATDSDTQYSAGTGLALSGTTFKLNGGEIAASVDLNTMRSTGVFSQNSNSDASSGSNYPQNLAGILEVWNDDYGNGLFTVQRYSSYNNTNVYNRIYYNGTWGSWRNLSLDTNTNTTYSAGSGLDLTSTTFSVEPDLRDGITHVGKDANNYIQFDSTNGRIDFYAGGNFVARMESDGDLHIKGDVIAFSNIFG